MSDNPAYSPPPCVVLIEDDPLVRLGQETLLRDWGYRVIAVFSREAIHEALKDYTDVAAIIADFDLGGRDTGPALALMVAETARRPIPTIILSASYGESSKRIAAQHGFAHYTKPFNAEALRLWLVSAIAERN